MRRILIAHATRYPKWALDDLYKLLHQAALGSGHALTDETQARQWLARELKALGSGPQEPLIDPISPDGQVVRVHLRPFVRTRLDTELLFGGFIRTASLFRGSDDGIVEYAQAAIDLAREGGLPFDSDEIVTLIADLRRSGFPAIHHSAAFEATYRPAYRVVVRDHLPSEIIAAASQLDGVDLAGR
jgi:hypothetical protein